MQGARRLKSPGLTEISLHILKLTQQQRFPKTLPSVATSFVSHSTIDGLKNTATLKILAKFLHMFCTLITSWGTERIITKLHKRLSIKHTIWFIANNVHSLGCATKRIAEYRLHSITKPSLATHERLSLCPTMPTQPPAKRLPARLHTSCKS